MLFIDDFMIGINLLNISFNGCSMHRWHGNFTVNEIPCYHFFEFNAKMIWMGKLVITVWLNFPYMELIVIERDNTSIGKFWEDTHNQWLKFSQL